MSELIRRAEDLARRCEARSIVTHTVFLTPSERAALEPWRRARRIPAVWHGGFPEPERQVLFFLPFWLEPAAFDPAEYLCAVKIHAPFGAPAHRDYLGAVLGLGVERDRLGDLFVQGDAAYFPCFEQAQRHILQQLTHVGRFGAQPQAIALAQLPVPVRTVKKRAFTVSSLRLDAVIGGLFRLSRTQAAQKIRLGAVTLNGTPCLRQDAPVKPGDVLCLRGGGKGTVGQTGGTSRKGRIFLECELWE